MSKERVCAICGKPQDAKYKPFCSKRCGEVDLNRWFKGSYAIPVVEENEKPEDERGED